MVKGNAPGNGDSEIKFVDKRRFTATGHTRTEALAQTESKTASPGLASSKPAAQLGGAPPSREASSSRPTPTSHAEDASGRAEDASGSAPPETPPATFQEASGTDGVDFLSFVASLATHAMAALGLLPETQRRGVAVNPSLAREYIEIIAMLQDRTQGNLSPEEDQALHRLLTDLRLQYVEVTRVSGSEPSRLLYF